MNKVLGQGKCRIQGEHLSHKNTLVEAEIRSFHAIFKSIRNVSELWKGFGGIVKVLHVGRSYIEVEALAVHIYECIFEI